MWYISGVCQPLAQPAVARTRLHLSLEHPYTVMQAPIAQIQHKRSVRDILNRPRLHRTYYGAPLRITRVNQFRA